MLIAVATRSKVRNVLTAHWSHGFESTRGIDVYIDFLSLCCVVLCFAMAHPWFNEPVRFIFSNVNFWTETGHRSVNVRKNKKYFTSR
jgi:hypothetical protein